MSALIDLIAYRWKALAAFLTPAVVVLAAPMATGVAPASEDYWKALAAALLTGFAVERVGNRPDAGEELVDPDGLIYAVGDEVNEPGEHRAES